MTIGKTARGASFALMLGAMTLGQAAVADAPLSIAKQGYLYAGGEYRTVGGQQYVSGALYAEYQIPARKRHPYPIIMVHGRDQSGTNFTGTPDGREGWAQYFLRQGYAVYVLDTPGRGRAGYRPELYAKATDAGFALDQQRFMFPELYNLWPEAKLHTQWPAKPTLEDPVNLQFLAAQLPTISSFPEQQALNRKALGALIDRIGPVILMTHSQSGAFGWPALDDRPGLIKGLIQVEPNGPPVHDLDYVGAPDYFRELPADNRPWGLTAEKLTYSPAVTDPSQLKFELEPASEAKPYVRCWRQAGPARQLVNLQKSPILIVTSEASYHAGYEHCTVRYLEQAGVRPTWIQLGKVGVHGNGHMMMLEKNNLEVAAVIERWARTIK
jgi:pimeloyl-ACP methyl ester carboxylesterase